MFTRIGNAIDEVMQPRPLGTTFPSEDLMSDAMSFVEIDGQRVEPLPARTVLSLFSAGGGRGGTGRGGLG
ncbi:MAG TPA: hypothetical protein VIY28_00155 [Pseudonocardiaceae bacterium]